MIKKMLFTIGYSHVYAMNGAIVFRAGMTIDADGSPHAYHPKSVKGLDALGNAGHPGNWWGLATDTGRPTGKPLIQKTDHAAPGFYVSTTALEIPEFDNEDPRRYIDSEKVPFIVLPNRIGLGLKLGDFCMCYNTATGDSMYGIYADIGPSHHIGEGSIALAETLSIPSNPRHGGVGGGIIYWVLPGSGKGYQEQHALVTQANDKFRAWGNLKELKKLMD